MQKKYKGQDVLDVLTKAKNYNNFLIKQIIKACPNGLDVLDFGAGIGTFAKPLRQKGFRVTCLELDPQQARLLERQNFKICSSPDDLPNNRLSFIYSLNVLEHIKEDQKTLRQLQAKLTTGGKMLIYVPALSILYAGLDKKVGHYRRYSKKDLSQKLKTAGFNIDSLAYADSLGALAALIYKWFGSNTGQLSKWQIFFYDRLLFPISRALDILAHPFFGKNLLVVVTKPVKKQVKNDRFS